MSFSVPDFAPDSIQLTGADDRRLAFLFRLTPQPDPQLNQTFD